MKNSREHEADSELVGSELIDHELPKWSWYPFLLYLATNAVCYGSYGTFGISIVFLAAKPGNIHNGSAKCDRITSL